MKAKYDPLSFIPSPETVRNHVTQVEALLRRLRILLRVSERIHQLKLRGTDQVVQAGEGGNHAG